MAEEVLEWKMMWGAKVKTPVDMPDDILKDAIDVATKELSKCEHFDDSVNEETIKNIKDHMDSKWEPHWHVIVGRNFGSKVTHEVTRFVYFYLQDKAVMIYKG